MHFDKAPPLPWDVEHHMPDYHLYDGVQNDREYTDYSIGFLTRGCFRKCGFCVNQKYDRVFRASPLEEFYDHTRKKICLLDDNFFGFKDWKSDLLKLMATGKPFKFKQGLDERLLTEEKCEMLFSAKYDGDYTFAFDNVEDSELIERKLKMIREYYEKEAIKFYVLVGFKGTGIEDVEGALKRISLLRKYRALPYIMRYMSKDDAPYKHSEWKSMYVLLARWCNQPSFCKKNTLWHYTTVIDQRSSSAVAYINVLERIKREYPRIADKYFYQDWGE